MSLDHVLRMAASDMLHTSLMSISKTLNITNLDRIVILKQSLIYEVLVSLRETDEAAQSAIKDALCADLKLMFDEAFANPQLMKLVREAIRKNKEKLTKND